MHKNSTYSELGPSSWVESSLYLRRFLCVCACAFQAAEAGGCRLVMEVDCGTRKSSVLGDVAPVTGTRRAVTHCDRACTNAQRPKLAPNSPHKSSAIQIAARCWQQRKLPSRCRHCLRQHLPPAPVTRPSQHTLRPLTPENLLPYISLHRKRCSRRAPSIANPIEASLWSKHLRFRDLPHKVAHSTCFA